MLQILLRLLLKIIVAITGASGGELGFRLHESLPADVEKILIVSQNSKITMQKEGVVFDEKSFWEGPASGSFMATHMIIAPCSLNTLAKIRMGLSDNLITRAAGVMLKEKRPLILAPREMPFDTIALENMSYLSRLGVVIAPPVYASYQQAKDLSAMQDFFVGKWLDLLGIKNSLYKRWE